MKHAHLEKRTSTFHIYIGQGILDTFEYVAAVMAPPIVFLIFSKWPQFETFLIDSSAYKTASMF